MTEIRRAQLADHDALVALWVDAGLGRMTEEEWNSIIVHPAAVILVAADGEEIVGSVIASFDGWRAHIYHVAVASNQRHRGVAKALMRKAEEHLFREGAGSIYVMVHQQNRGGARAFCGDGLRARRRARPLERSDQLAALIRLLVCHPAATAQSSTSTRCWRRRRF